MCFRSLGLAGLLIFVFNGTVPSRAHADPPAAQPSDVVRRYKLDPASPLESRVRATPEYILKLFKEDGRTTPTPHVLTDEEQRKLSAAFAALPPLHRLILTGRLRSISFLDGMPNTGLTATVNPDDSYKLFDITIRAGVLHQNVSEWLTEKERSCFDTASSPLSVSVEAGTQDALIYVILHEATHIVDTSLGMTPATFPGEPTAPGAPATAFTRGIWSDRITPVPVYRDPLRERIRFYVRGKVLPID